MEIKPVTKRGMSVYFEIPLPDSGVLRIHYDGSSSTAEYKEFMRKLNNKMPAILEILYGDDEPLGEDNGA